MTNTLIMRCFITILILLAHSVAFCQQNNNWCFGDNAAVRFNTNPPTSYASKVSSFECVATMSHPTTGMLMFYTDGVYVWDADHNLMPNGSYIGNDPTAPPLGTSAQGAVIVPFVHDTSLYYIFTVSNFDTSGDLHYSIVDMSLNGGKGDIVQGKKAVLIDSNFSEAITVVPDCNSYWLLVSKRDHGSVSAYHITDHFPNTIKPVVSSVDVAYDFQHKISPDREQLAITGWKIQNSRVYFYLKVYGFDVATGRVKDTALIDQYFEGLYVYGCEFSPNSKMLYTSFLGTDSILNVHTTDIVQYDLSLPDTTQIAASATVFINNLDHAWGLQMAPDSNIYVTGLGFSYLGRITQANKPYPDCVFTQHAVPLVAGTNAQLNLPQAVVYSIKGDRGHLESKKEIIVCEDERVLQAPQGMRSYRWQDGSTAQNLTINKTGKYWVTMIQDACVTATDTFDVALNPVTVSLREDTTICTGDSLVLDAGIYGADVTYRWNTGSRDSFLVVYDGGTYELTVNMNSCIAKDTMMLSVYAPISITLGSNKYLCNTGEQIQLPVSATYDGITSYLWQDGSTDNRYTVYGAGEYYVSASNICETVSDTVVYTERNCKLFFPSAFSPNGDGRNDIAHLLGDVGGITRYDMRIVNRWGEVVYHTTDPLQGWDGMYKGQKAELSTYHYLIRYTHLGEEGTMKGDLLLVR